MTYASVDVLITDFGPVVLKPDEAAISNALPRRKNGAFDLRFNASRAFLGSMNKRLLAGFEAEWRINYPVQN